MFGHILRIESKFFGQKYDFLVFMNVPNKEVGKIAATTLQNLFFQIFCNKNSFVPCKQKKKAIKKESPDVLY